MKLKDLSDPRADAFVDNIEQMLQTCPEETIEHASWAVERHWSRWMGYYNRDEGGIFKKFIDEIKQTEEYKALEEKYSYRDKS